MKGLIRFLDWMLNPYIIIGFFVVGGVMGHFLPDFSYGLAPYGELFISLLMLCVIPLMVTAITSGLAHIIRNYHAKAYFLRMVIVFVVTILICSTLGFLLALVTGLGKGLSESVLTSLGQLVGVSLQSNNGHVINHFLESMTPANLLSAFSHSVNVSVLCFSILFGVALGFMTRRTGRSTLRFIEAIYHAMLRVITGIIYLLPYALLCITASEVSKLGMGVFYSMGSLILVCYLGAVCILLVQVLITAIRLRMTFFHVLGCLKESLIVAFVTSNSFAVIPLAIKSFGERLNFNENKTNLFFPLGVTFNPQGTAFLIGLVTIYMMHVYQLPVTFSAVLVIIVGSLFASIAIGGLPFVAGMSLLAIIFKPLGLPLSVFVVIMAALSNILDPIITATNIGGNFMTVSLLPRDSTDQTDVLFPHKSLY
jgi:proton glutamate symport protein